MYFKLLHGDCLELMKEIPDNSIDLIYADVPYGTTRCAWDEIIPLMPMWEQLKRIIKPNGVIAMHAAQPFTSVLTCSNLGMFKYEIVWEKGNATGFYNAKKQPLRAHEHILIFCDGIGTYNPQMTHGHKRKAAVKKPHHSDVYNPSKVETTYDSTSRYPRSVQFFSSDKQKRKGEKINPTRKPVALCEWVINTYSNHGDTVLDFCFGSCSSGIASMNTGRNYIGIEQDDEFYADAFTKYCDGNAEAA
ncbi:DNA-methyltransferase [Shewanella xiamenensis]|uniref:DNA-methyltransferase n=1 Tax=Shewanella xiamenensis TaxID=332186 RepID=UPI00217CE4A9|nr:site-specific DNA-methyltransferase [Shewanella xiamenensis]MCT8874183.1 site-specific DNA-methyltransferase [Shewanella xiamenensis]UWH42854.1 site-specific DNA-methyltransferase [Shewanella xiamenensis]